MGRLTDFLPTPDIAPIAERLKQLRKHNNLTQNQVAAGSGINRSSLANYESAATEPKPDHIRKLASFYGVSTDYILYGEDPSRPGLSPNAQILYETMQGMTEDELSQLIDFAMVLKKHRQ